MLSSPAHSPQGWIKHINPRYGTDLPWGVNCGDCSRSFLEVFHGTSISPAAGELKRAGGWGEDKEMSQWAGVNAKKMSNFQEVFTFIGSSPAGTCAIVGNMWDTKDGGGHWYNVYKGDDGQVHVADAQQGWTRPASSGFPYETPYQEGSFEVFARTPQPDGTWLK